MAKPYATVGVRELKSKLSEYVRRASGGETVLVGDRRHLPIAQLAPLAVPRDLQHVEALERDGVVLRGSGRPGAHPPVKPKGTGSIAAMVVEDRR